MVARAFHQQPEVADLVEAIRASKHYRADLAFVATVDGDVVGYVLGSDVTLVDGPRRHRVVSLSPLAVAPERQRRGIGSALVHALCEAASDRGEPLVVLEGDPRYYSRFGFEYSVPLGIRIHLPSWAAPEAGQVRRLPAYDPAVRGLLEYPPAFDIVAAH